MTQPTRDKGRKDSAKLVVRAEDEEDKGRLHVRADEEEKEKRTHAQEERPIFRAEERERTKGGHENLTPQGNEGRKFWKKIHNEKSTVCAGTIEDSLNYMKKPFLAWVALFSLDGRAVQKIFALFLSLLRNRQSPRLWIPKSPLSRHHTLNLPIMMYAHASRCLYHCFRAKLPDSDVNMYAEHHLNRGAVAESYKPSHGPLLHEAVPNNAPKPMSYANG